MNFNKIDKILATEPKFRTKQIGRLIWRDLIDDWGQASTLPIALRAKLKLECPLEIKAEVFKEKDDKSAKALITLEDGLNVETVLMRHQGRNTICVSSQVGCPLGCVFCATGKMGFKRNLLTGEITEQVLFWSRWLKRDEVSLFEKRELRGISKSSPALLLQRRETGRVDNVVFMGMGEPFLNYDNVFEAIKILNDDNLLGIGSRHISISTAGIVEGIERMSEDMPQINLAISLHAPNDKLRQKLMPIAKKYPLAAVITAARDYVAKTNRKLMFEYIMIKDVNDSPEQAKELARLLKNPLFFVNLIAYNPTGDLASSKPTQIKKFKDILMRAGVQALERYRFGQDIKGACGQLTSQNKNL
ncbi:23S rRNA (adenine(2503)-C(2))-methyltransferase RlmN [Patescibacteria group bacterium]|nr:23S rRNA (adenine(2503)-C(2))-methyltransferase RlmN [Patescibacteria group bacterium]MBU2220031.1 23S rRNA (adenine(2503)-C(2))-methyltransferase RlmN [Patescibacteria group bacterium]MBU2264879.1 23S rRNA (adenine(2503)-C(2))-methyltransferase RlmN [Patescibacteria group bacterium]